VEYHANGGSGLWHATGADLAQFNDSVLLHTATAGCRPLEMPSVNAVMSWSGPVGGRAGATVTVVTAAS